MKNPTATKLASVMFYIVTAVFVLNLAALIALPILFGLQAGHILANNIRGGIVPETFALTLFLEICGVCTAIILWQARRILMSLRRGMPFKKENAGYMKTAGISCFFISGAALIRAIHDGIVYGIASFASYNTLFVPVALFAGLLCLVMAALFFQAAELKDDNDLVI